MWLIRMREWEIGAISGRLQDNPGELTCMLFCLSIGSLIVQAPVVQTSDSAIQRLNNQGQVNFDCWNAGELFCLLEV